MPQLNTDINPHCTLALKFPIEIIRIIRAFSTTPDAEIIELNRKLFFSRAITHCMELSYYLREPNPREGPLAFGREKDDTLAVLDAIINYLQEWYKNGDGFEIILRILNRCDILDFLDYPKFNPDLITLDKNFKDQIISNPLRIKIIGGSRYLTGD